MTTTPSPSFTFTLRGVSITTQKPPRDLATYLWNLKGGPDALDVAAALKVVARPWGTEAVKAAVRATRPEATGADLDAFLALLP